MQHSGRVKIVGSSPIRSTNSKEYYMSYEEFERQLNQLAQNKYTDQAIDLIYDYIDDRLLDGNFAHVDFVLEDIDMGRLPTVLHLSFLTVTLAAKSKLNNRTRFFDKAFNRVACKEGLEKADRLFKGLE